MSERFYPPTEAEQLKQRILIPQPLRVPYSPTVDFFEPTPAPVPTLANCLTASPITSTLRGMSRWGWSR